MKEAEHWDMMHVPEEVVESPEDECLVRRRKVAKAADGRVSPVQVDMVGRGASAVIGHVVISARSAIPAALESRSVPDVSTNARRGAQARPLGGTIDTLQPLGSTSVALWHGATAFRLARMAAETGLANAATGRITCLEDTGAYGGVIVGTCEAQADAVVADVAVPITANLARTTGHAGVGGAFGRIGSVHMPDPVSGGR